MHTLLYLFIGTLNFDVSTFIFLILLITYRNLITFAITHWIDFIVISSNLVEAYLFGKKILKEGK